MKKFVLLVVFLILVVIPSAHAMVFVSEPMNLFTNEDFAALVNSGWTMVSYFDPLYYVSSTRSSVVFYVSNDYANQMIIRVHGVVSPVASLTGILFTLPLHDGSFLTDYPLYARRHYPPGAYNEFSVAGNDLKIDGSMNNGMTFRLIYESAINLLNDVDYYEMTVKSLYGDTVIPNSMLLPEYRVPYDDHTPPYEPYPHYPPPTPTPTPNIPEASTILLLLSGLMGIPLVRKK